ncbi:uracil reductase [Pleomassaria siparia CBS 279.74]|uniref:2,5-diamino-6-ribosylamino-4(3H)-pyrimidinone 5'-phosphate reductase n=1 Tax=Pleomassaria siparia CBS 279.74 TaxID=1314801 RepID=A0A6G1K052_9PLEO|nr:uracil reductase [Pleomassaria siparia CBS 279.74]
MTIPRDALTFSVPERELIRPYLPPITFASFTTPATKPHVTLTFATSLDTSLSLSPGIQTALSGPFSKSMTHHLRSQHDAILVGVGTVLADDPSLNCRIEGVGGYGGERLRGQPRPVILDPRGRWDWTLSKVCKLAKEGKGWAPWVVKFEDRDGVGEEERIKERGLVEVGGQVLRVPRPSLSTCPTSGSGSKFEWSALISRLADNGILSVMIEGGGAVINDLLHPQNFHLVDTVIVTIAPTWLGQGGVQVCPEQRVENGVKLPVGRLRDVKWVPLGEDVVLCGRPSEGSPPRNM